MVLIVAKCIVNKRNGGNWCEIMDVLIVAKCIVNERFAIAMIERGWVLIVAKCIVNMGNILGGQNN